MRQIFTITSLILAGQSFGQQKEVMVKLADNVTLTFLRDTFNPKASKIEMADNVVISIDDGLVFGTDGGMPRTYLKKATLTIGTRKFDLQVDGMYNPWHEDHFNDKVFKLKTEGSKYKITGGFSDGAGYYGVEWIVSGKGCARTILTNDEKILFEYMEK